MTESNPINVARGKKSRASGADFERRTRKDLEDKGWIVDKWSNNVEFETSKKRKLIGVRYPTSTEGFNIIGNLIPAKRKYAGPGRPMAIGTGFPDFIAFRKLEECRYQLDDGDYFDDISYQIIGVECKTNGTLDSTEKEKCRWYLKNNIFSKILIASKTKEKNKIVIKYEDFEERYGKI